MVTALGFSVSACCSSFGGSTLPCDLSSLIDLQRAVDFQRFFPPTRFVCLFVFVKMEVTSYKFSTSLDQRIEVLPVFYI